jgi:hypothetical protein
MCKANRPVIHSISATLVVSALMLICPAAAIYAGQGSSPNKPNEAAALAKARAMIEAINQRARELGLVSISDEDQAEFYQRRMQAQLNDDFVKLYSINAEKLAALDPRGLSDAAADLKERATRIKYNVRVLMVAPKGQKPRYDQNPDQLPSMLPELGRLVESFLTSPVFRQSSPNDAELRAKAVRDLDGIIALCDTISKLAKRVSKIEAQSK